ncbi:MAG: hypothetical protein QNJ31_08110 [Candidatus Caenarcaniphilales bacterium]|nr:hypothetical protein [Candidatus Caenarcaniphilales bacterium]
MQSELTDKTGERTKETQRTKEWQGASFLVSCTFTLFLLSSCFIGTWGLISPTPGEIKLFPQAFVVYFFSKLLTLPWLLSSFGIFIVLGCYFSWIDPLEMYLGYYVGLFFALIIISKLSFPFWILAPIAIHLFGICYLGLFESLVNQNTFTSNFELFAYFKKVLALSRESFVFEIFLVYPLVFLSVQVNKVLNIFRFLE